VNASRSIVADCGLSTDVSSGFCGETEEQHQDTLSMMEHVVYDMAYMFFYSERPGTLAARKYADDVPHEIKIRRLNEIIALQTRHALERNRSDIGKTFRVLVEKTSKRSAADMCGRNDQNKMIVFPGNGTKPGDYVHVKVLQATSATLMGEIV